MTIDTKRPVSVKLAPCEERRRRWLEIEQNLCDAALRMGKEPHLGEGWYRRIVKPELTLLADEIDRLRDANESMPVCARHIADAHAESDCWRCEIENLSEQLAMVRDLINSAEGSYASDSANDAVEYLAEKVRSIIDGKRVPELEDES